MIFWRSLSRNFPLNSWDVFLNLSRQKNRCNGKQKSGSLTLGTMPPDLFEDRSPAGGSGPTPHGEAHTTALHAVNGYHAAVSRGVHGHLQLQRDFMADFLPISALNVTT